MSGRRSGCRPGSRTAKPTGTRTGKASRAARSSRSTLTTARTASRSLIVSRTKTKKFLQKRPDGVGGWEWKGIPNEQKVPFRLGELTEAISLDKLIYICEGEKACLSLIEKGYPATCSPGGAGKWPSHFRRWFKDARRPGPPGQ